jgi:hypothetical protein
VNELLKKSTTKAEKKTSLLIGVPELGVELLKDAKVEETK